MRQTWASSLLAAFLVITCSTTAPAQDHLEPIDAETDPLASYHELLHEVFGEIYADGTDASAIIIPSFFPETAVAIRRESSGYSVITLTPAKHLWRYELAKHFQAGEIEFLNVEDQAQEVQRAIDEITDGLPPNPTDVRLKRCKRRMSAEAGAQLVKVWRVMLDDVRDVPEDSGAIVLDGTSYEFWARNGTEERRGSTLALGGRASSMGELANELVNFCKRRTNEATIGRLASSIVATE